MALYIVFLGIIPVIAIAAFLMYYAKHNVNFKWQKTSVAYVVSNCLKHVGCACCGGRQTPTVPTLSHQVANRQSESTRCLNLEITPGGLISTTNTYVLNNFAGCSTIPVQSHNEPQKRRMSFKNIMHLKLNTSLKFRSSSNNESTTPKTTETICPDDESQLQYVNVRNLTKQFDNN